MLYFIDASNFTPFVIILFSLDVLKICEAWTAFSGTTAWTLGYFTPFFYLITVASLTSLTLPALVDFVPASSARYTQSPILKGRELLMFAGLPLIYFTLLNWTWVGPTTTLWFNHLLFTGTHLKLNLILTSFFALTLLLIIPNTVFVSQENYDYFAIWYNCFFWITLLYLVNNLFTLIFFLEVLATLVNLLLISSTFGTTTFYNNLNLHQHAYFQPTTPFAFLQTLITYFWISLMAALNLFLFLLLTYLRFFSFEWSLLEAFFTHILLNASLKSLFVGGVLWVNFLGALFLKAGIVPFFFWKPSFFKGMPLPTLAFYVTVYYFWLLLFFFLFLSLFISDVFHFYTALTLTFLFVGLFFLVGLVFESLYLKTFFAISSTLNTLLTLLALTSLSFVDPTLYFIG